MLPGALFAVVLIGAFVVDGSEGAKIESFPIAANFNFKVTGPGDTLPARDRARFKTLFARQQAVEARQQGVGLKNAVTSYTLNVRVGSPQTSYELLIDTGSAYTWLGASKSYVPTATSNNQGEKFSITYGSGSASGNTWKDLVVLSPSLNVTQNWLGVASSSQGLEGLDGILGLGPTDLNDGVVGNGQLAPTIMDELFDQGEIAEKMFGLSFVPTTSNGAVDGELTFGGTDSSKYVGDLTWVPITQTSPANQYWGIDQTIKYGDTTIQASTAGIVDSGTTLVLLADEAFNAYAAALPGSKISEATGLLEIPEGTVNQMQSVFFDIGGVSFEFTADAQIWPRALNSQIGGDSDKYYSVISQLGSRAGQGLDFIVGYVFMQRFYTAHDMSDARIGFANTESTLVRVNLGASL